MESVPDYFFSQCSSEEKFIQITKCKIWYKPTSLFKVNFGYTYKNYIHKTQLFCVFMLLFLTMLPPDWYLFFRIKLHLDFFIESFTLFSTFHRPVERGYMHEITWYLGGEWTVS